MSVQEQSGSKIGAKKNPKLSQNGIQNRSRNNYRKMDRPGPTRGVGGDDTNRAHLIRTVPWAPERVRFRQVAYLGFTHFTHASLLSFPIFRMRFPLDGVILSSFAALGRFPAGR